ncbi:MAG TPA: hypothetical protein PL187_23590, partial [Caldilinea sp.]|nr:hypothetical protein [Caldilinea sp.]
ERGSIIMDDQWIDKDAALISPDAKFRHDLAQALQDSHERQRVQRQLYGSAPSAQRGQALFWRLLGALGLLALVFSLGFYVGQQSHKLRGYVD